MSQKIDITSSFNALISLESWLKIPGERILQYVFLNKATYSAENFIEKFSREEKTLLEDKLDIVSLHVTTNNDNCNSIKKYGLLNLQEAIILDTSLSNYIKAYGVLIDLNNKVIEYQGNTYDISKRYIRATQGSKESHLDMVVYKSFKDYQINGFICHKNALTYGGGVSHRPEFLCNLANALGNANIENDWYKNNLAPVNN